MTHSKKILPSLLAVALLSSGIALTMPAAAFATTGGLSVDNASISNGQAQTVHFGSHAGLIPETPSGAGSQQMLCQYEDGVRGGGAFGAGDTVPATASVAAGSFSDDLNFNQGGVTRTMEWVAITANFDHAVPTPSCSDLPESRADLAAYSSAFLTGVTVDDSVSWTVLPALTSPITQTIYVGQNNSTPANYTVSYALPILNPVGGSLWMNQSMYPCDNLNDADATVLPGDLAVDETYSAPGVLANLVVSGTPPVGSEGTYRLCVTLGGDDGYVAGFFDLTIADAPVVPVALAETGLDSRAMTLTGFAGLSLLAFGAFGMIVRRRALKK